MYAPIVSFEEDWADVRPPPQKSYFGRHDQDGTAYVGVRLEAPNVVTVNNDLPLRRDLFAHSRGFAWGYLGSGPSQLALAILADFLGDDERAVRLHHQFKETVIARLPGDDEWELEGATLHNTIERIESLDVSQAKQGSDQRS